MVISRTAQYYAKIDAKAKDSDAEEPDTLVSGNFDELKIRRNEKNGDEDE